MNITNPFALINEYKENAPVEVKSLIKALGLKFYEANYSNEISGAIEKSDDGTYVITVNRNDSETRKRFTMAHELGHYILHRDKIGDGIKEDRMYRAITSNYQIGNKQETQANQFAASLLMPKELIESLRIKGYETPEELAKQLSVSVQAMRIRLKNL